MPQNKPASFNEAEFQKWYRNWAQVVGIDPNPDNPLHRYDYRAAYMAGAQPEINSADNAYHWPSQFKALDHPNRFVSRFDTITGKPEPGRQIRTQSLFEQLNGRPAPAPQPRTPRAPIRGSTTMRNIGAGLLELIGGKSPFSVWLGTGSAQEAAKAASPKNFDPLTVQPMGAMVPLSTAELLSTAGLAGRGASDAVELLRAKGVNSFTPRTLREFSQQFDDAFSAYVDRAAETAANKGEEALAGVGSDITEASGNSGITNFRNVIQQTLDDSLAQLPADINLINTATPAGLSRHLSENLAAGQNPGLASLADAVDSWNTITSGGYRDLAIVQAAKDLVEHPIKDARDLMNLVNKNFAGEAVEPEFVEAATLLHAVDSAAPIARPLATSDNLMSGTAIKALHRGSRIGDIVSLPLEELYQPGFVATAAQGAPPGMEPKIILSIEGPVKYLDTSPSKWAFSQELGPTRFPRETRESFLTQGSFEIVRRETAAARGLRGVNPTTEVITLRQVGTHSPTVKPLPTMPKLISSSKEKANVLGQMMDADENWGNRVEDFLAKPEVRDLPKDKFEELLDYLMGRRRVVTNIGTKIGNPLERLRRARPLRDIDGRPFRLPNPPRP